MHKSASKVGTIRWTNGNEVSFFIGSNSNTGETIVWQKHVGREQRFTGANIKRLLTELTAALAAGDCKWLACNATVLSAWERVA